MLVKFKIWGNLRFLSHAETIKVFQRACIRAGIKIQYSQGFNPRPKLSLPLPRSVGVESDDELFCLRVENSAESFDSERFTPLEMLQQGNNMFENEKFLTGFRAKLSAQLPEGCELLSVRLAEAKTSLGAGLATYVLAVQEDYLDEKLKTRIKRLLESKSINLQRHRDVKDSKFKIQNSKPKNVDVRPFLESIKLDGNNIAVKCRISSAGSIRVDEILKLLELDAEKLAAPIRRTSVQWHEV